MLNENGHVGIGVNIRDVGVLEIIRDFICPDLPIADHSNGSMKRLLICSTQWYESIKKHLNLNFKKGESHKKSRLVQMPVDISDSLKWCFLRRLFEGDGWIGKYPTKGVYYLRVGISSSSLAMRMMITTFCKKLNINICMNSKDVQLNGQYAAQFIEKIYEECDEIFVLKRKYDIYKKLKVELSRFWDSTTVA